MNWFSREKKKTQGMPLFFQHKNTKLQPITKKLKILKSDGKLYSLSISYSIILLILSIISYFKYNISIERNEYFSGIFTLAYR